MLCIQSASINYETSDRDPELVWSRWKKQVVDKQIATAKGAERYLRSGRPVYIDDRMTTPMPLPLAQNLKVHKIVIAHGAKDACKAFSEANISGSLAISYDDNRDELAQPFHVQIGRAHV